MKDVIGETMRLRSIRLVIAVALTMTAGCSTSEQSRLTGQIVGTAVGVVAGAQFGQGIGTIFAASHGAWLGFHLGELTQKVLGDKVGSSE